MRLRYLKQQSTHRQGHTIKKRYESHFVFRAIAAISQCPGLPIPTRPGWTTTQLKSPARFGRTPVGGTGRTIEVNLHQRAPAPARRRLFEDINFTMFSDVKRITIHHQDDRHRIYLQPATLFSAAPRHAGAYRRDVIRRVAALRCQRRHRSRGRHARPLFQPMFAPDETRPQRFLTVIGVISRPIRALARTANAKLRRNISAVRPRARKGAGQQQAILHHEPDPAPLTDVTNATGPVIRRDLDAMQPLGGTNVRRAWPGSCTVPNGDVRRGVPRPRGRLVGGLVDEGGSKVVIKCVCGRPDAFFSFSTAIGKDRLFRLTIMPKRSTTFRLTSL